MTNTGDIISVPDGLEPRVASMRQELIDLSGDADKLGKRIVKDVRGAISDMGGKGGFPKLVGDSFLAGSFGRKTQALPLDDIDIFVPLDAASLQLETPAQAPAPGSLVSGSNDVALGCAPDLQTGAWLDSGKVLDHIVPLLWGIPLAGVSDVKKNPRGKCAQLTYLGINVDLVFVLHSTHPGQIDRFHLPSGDSWCWRTSNPRNDQQRLSIANQTQHNGLLLPTIRCLKAWNDHACGGRLKSIHLEVLATTVLFANVSITSTVSALTYAFQQLPAALSQSCPDPTGLGPDLDTTLHLEDREWVIEAARRAHAQATAATAKAATSVEAAADAWRALLMTDVPEKPERPRTPSPIWHNADFGQPAHHCSEPRAVVPLARVQDRPSRPSNQQAPREYA